MVFDSNVSFILGYEHIAHRNLSEINYPDYNVLPILFGANGIFDGTRVSMYLGIKAYNVTAEFIDRNSFKRNDKRYRNS